MLNNRFLSFHVLLLVSAPAITAVDAAEVFKKLSGAQIRSRIIGMEITDGVHWAELYHKDGVLTVWGMGRKYSGRWKTMGDELCTTVPQREDQCKEVWISVSNRVEFRVPGIDLPAEGTLMKQQPRTGGR